MKGKMFFLVVLMVLGLTVCTSFTGKACEKSPPDEQPVSVVFCPAGVETPTALTASTAYCDVGDFQCHVAMSPSCELAIERVAPVDYVYVATGSGSFVKHRYRRSDGNGCTFINALSIGMIFWEFLPG